ncbi:MULTISPECIES: hypothetical protein [Capnocytophaga]|uniref:Uncharacterized protein n=1 Tax=Capnocytophaga canis TaxID=1848903 RepID=A0A0B7IF05_9FLAO|nr:MULTISPECIES: hypothetical protein [Capnocytophaga]ATA72160.1 hypothetical protein CGC49_01850 [Capnocytophaga sp. H4358]ATA74279.1 hypothetical protein CGC52_01795 [Capnocytophaga sp. H2931]RIY37585.1 hypothetical protein CKY20_02490 [Capnocytophaga canis]CEN42477.1 conserved membrane hypothetical protein [Capnocytophaga canis]CEN48553.1 conserved membrane hypothetical protein [Capnocytophaga canis]
MKKHQKDIIIGLFVGLIANALGILLYILIFSRHSIELTIRDAYVKGYLGALIALGGLLDLASFFVLLRLGQDNRAKGVIMASMILALVILMLEFN